MYSGYVHLVMHWLFMEAAASKALSGGPSAMKPDKALYEAKISMSEYLLAESCATLARVQW
jgi:hypothetical protein